MIYKQAKSLIRNGDIILFRRNNFPSVGWWIGKYTQSPYSHVGLAHWEQDELYCVEFREFIGSRCEPLSNQIDESCGRMDIFRAIDVSFIDKGILCSVPFTEEISYRITNFAKSLVGKPYGWYTIWRIFKSYSPFLRFFYEKGTDDKIDSTIYVCSTTVVASYRKFWLDLVPYMSDDYVSPGDIARSGLIRKILTIDC